MQMDTGRAQTMCVCHVLCELFLNVYVSGGKKQVSVEGLLKAKIIIILW